MKRVLVLLIALVAAAMPLAASAQGYDPYGRDSRYGYDDRNGYDNRYGRNPAYDGDNGATQVRCESRDHRIRRCRIDTRGGVRLVRRESDAPCVRSRTWGYNRDGIWVTSGCRAVFEVGRVYASRGDGRDNWRYDDSYNERYGYDNGSAGAQVFRCESIDDQPRLCRLPFQVRSVQIRRQLSRTTCSEGVNWGWRADGVWVERGCRAEFVAY